MKTKNKLLISAVFYCCLSFFQFYPAQSNASPRSQVFSSQVSRSQVYGDTSKNLNFSKSIRSSESKLIETAEGEAIYTLLNEWWDSDIWNHRAEMLESIENSIRYLRSEQATSSYIQNGFGIDSKKLVERSLVRFKTLLLASRDAEELRKLVVAQFKLYRPVGNKQKNLMPTKFTAYFQPTFTASRVPTKDYKYPIYRLPQDRSPSWLNKTRVELEGFDGASGMLKGYEIAWLSNRYQVYLIHVQGSAILDLVQGGQLAVGFDAGTDFPFTGVGKSVMQRFHLPWPKLGEFFNEHPEELHPLLSKNNRFIFFKENSDFKPKGCLGVPVTAERSIATDKSMLPPGALGLIRTNYPKEDSGEIRFQKEARFVLDQDTGKAIIGPARVDIFMGTGSEAQRKASSVYSYGDLYYLLLRH
jgi:membrane-bound lytic murein transglycosylase A